MTTARTHDAPQPTHTADGRPILYTLAPGGYALAELDDGRVAVVRAKAGDAGKPPSRAEAEDANAATLRRVMAAAGGRK